MVPICRFLTVCAILGTSALQGNAFAASTERWIELPHEVDESNYHLIQTLRARFRDHLRAYRPTISDPPIFGYAQRYNITPRRTMATRWYAYREKDKLYVNKIDHKDVSTWYDLGAWDDADALESSAADGGQNE